MLTLFTTPKPFRGLLHVTQRNALESWTRLAPHVEILVFGEEAGAAEAAQALGLRYIPQIERNEFGTPYLNCIFDRANELARFDLLAYVNCDIILTGDFRAAVERCAAWRPDFLMVGRRWDTDVREPLDFSRSDWEKNIVERARAANRRRPAQFIDFFAFSRGLFASKIPPFAAGRPGFDNWLIWHARTSGAAVIDASARVTAVHQNHDHSHVPQGEWGFWFGEEARQNERFLDGGWKCGTISNATHRLTPHGFQRNYRHWLVFGKNLAYGGLCRLWFGLLNLTRPLRNRLGLRQAKVADLPAKER